MLFWLWLCYWHYYCWRWDAERRDAHSLQIRGIDAIIGRILLLRRVRDADVHAQFLLSNLLQHLE